jgi:hypothetical protein
VLKKRDVREGYLDMERVNGVLKVSFDNQNSIGVYSEELEHACPGEVLTGLELMYCKYQRDVDVREQTFSYACCKM